MQVHEPHLLRLMSCELMRDTLVTVARSPSAEIRQVNMRSKRSTTLQGGRQVYDMQMRHF
jgi:hypothetical protein